MTYLPLILIPLCALLNHLAGQSTTIPNPRIVCRVLGVSAVFYAVAALMLPFETALEATGIVLAGMAVFACPGWASGFLAIPPYNDTRQQTFLSSVVNWIMGVSYLDKLTPAQCHRWGTVYFSLRGLFIYPLFCALGFLLTPWAFLIGLGGALQGLIYGTSTLVSQAEWKMGALVGAMLAATILVS